MKQENIRVTEALARSDLLKEIPSKLKHCKHQKISKKPVSSKIYPAKP